MLRIMLSPDPTPVVQAIIYMAGILVGYLLLTQPEEWSRARSTVREAWHRRRQG